MTSGDIFRTSRASGLIGGAIVIVDWQIFCFSYVASIFFVGASEASDAVAWGIS
jgi:hypothetical protein